jgi:hypothetical protein
LNQAKNYLKEKNPYIDLDLIDPNFDIYESICEQFDLCMKSSQNSENAKLGLSSVDQMDSGGESDLGSYITKINSLHSSLRTPKESRKNSYSFDQNVDVLELTKEPQITIKDQFINLFFKTNKSKGIQKVTSEDKKQFEKIQNKIKKMKIRGTIKYTSILSLLKVNCEFLNDLEGAFYSLIDVLGLFPKKFVCKNEPVSVFDSELFRSYTNLEDASNQNFENLQRKKTFFTNAHIDLLLAVLSNINKNEFEKNEAGIKWLFNLKKSKKMNMKKRMRSKNQKKTQIEEKDCHKEGKQIQRYLRLKSLLEQINRLNFEKIIEIFNLKHSVLEVLLIKLSLCSSENYKFFPSFAKRFYSLLKKNIFNFLVYLMFSKKYHFVHKFCIILMIKSN